MSSSTQFAGPVRQFSLRRLVGVTLLLIGSVLATVGSVGADRALADGQTWSTRTSTDESAFWLSVAHGNGMFVAVGSGGRVMSSTDGATWTARTAPGTSNTWWRSVTFGAGQFVAVSDCYQPQAWQSLCDQRTARVMTSSDGISWVGQLALEGDWWKVAYGNNTFVAVSRTSGSGWNRVMASSDGTNWTAGTMASDDWKALAFGNGIFVAVGNGKVATSTDGLVWASASNVPNVSWESITYGGGTFVAGAGSRANMDANTFMTSSDGTTWTTVTVPVSGSWHSIVHDGSKFVAVGAPGKIMTSVNGSTWTALTGQPTNNGMAVNSSTWESVTYGRGMFVAVASQGPRVMTSGSSASISPATQTISGTEGTAITPSTAFTAGGFTPTSFTVSQGTLPAGLSIDSTSGVISGTPSAVSSAQVTITATNGSTTATATVTFNIAAAPPAVDLSPVNGVGNTFRPGTVGTPLNPPIVLRSLGMAGPVTFSAVDRTGQATYVPANLPPGLSIVSTSATAAEIVGTPTQEGQFPPFYISATDGTTTVYSSSSIIITVAAAAGGGAQGGGVVIAPAPPTTAPDPEGVGESDLITEERQEQLTSSAGDGKVLVNGELVDARVTQASAELRSSDPTQRSPQQVTELQDLAASILDQVSTALGGGTGSLSVRNTPTGAVILGLATDPVTGQPMEVPVENVVFVSGGGLVLVASGIDGRSPARIGLDGSVEIPEGGYVSVVAGGLTPGENGEVVVMSTPRLIGSFDVGESGDVREQAALPTDLGSGSHTLVVTVGDEAASLGFRVVPNGVRPTLPVTGGSNDLIVVWSLAFLVAGALVLALDRRRHLFTR